ncbi:arsenic transporter [Pseudonocardia sp. KRD-184]|uniref:Arsenic transporter n=1 Tax=Pseudonocardia oceani TaxID=2792013 RepID=A0ABS6UG94_9PSEU|nr:SLC13 family permease [Pseudonocardia oceani]MBW0092910.1 arsenic transporter [Pseudonocardia oceani]MBW0099666.1 arsenic transporter [Pseudonocardia oceani]MBW0112180.1 arsenic transporter [Pseudonocardia oceani]MBW0125623.1 arsenic transporter [Pseudonocardia oceani]MBW0131241.1 arsenic transporter [Pseudonocardia oceani]
MIDGALALVLLVVVLAFALASPRGLPEAVVAVPAAGLALLLGLVSPGAAGEEVVELGPTVAFLAAILLLGHLAGVEGVFAWLGARMAAAGRGSAPRLLGLTFAAASVTTAVLSLDATVVLLTPVVLATSRLLAVRARPHVYACTHLANSASLVLPVSNLTNLLAFAASGLTFLSFATLMAAPWLVVIAVEYAALRWWFRADLAATAPAAAPAPDLAAPDLAAPDLAAPDLAAPDLAAPRFALAVLAATLAGFGLSSLSGIEPVWVAAAGALVLGARVLLARRARPPALLRAADPLFCLFVLALGVVVEAVTANGLGAALAAVVPSSSSGSSLPGLLGLAALAAVLANVVNNIPATLVLLSVLGDAPAPGLVLAVLIGVNIGPNLTYVGSLATLLWRRVLAGTEAAPAVREFTGLGLLTVPMGLVAAVVALWAGLQLV